ncbi:MAG: hypothetical protein RIM84_12210 [Alphaproteobacteria bacterium]
MRLRDGVETYEHRYRGTAWLIVADDVNRGYFRGPVASLRLVQLLDGDRTVEQAYHLVQAEAGARAPSKDDVVELLQSLQAADLLQGVGSYDAGGFVERERRRARHRRQLRWRQPLTWRLPLLEPDALLIRCAEHVGWLFRPTWLYVWCLLAGTAAVAGWLHRHEIAEHAEARFADPSNLVWFLFLYPLIKLLHEAGHGLAARHWGCRVREFGIVFLVFVPLPYVDASASHKLHSKYQRMVVGAAGIIVEVGLAAMALWAWLYLDPGLARDIAFDIMVIGGLSTVVFNGNPLLRFDGYYVLSDFLESPNLGQRSVQYLGYLLKRHVVGLKQCRRPIVARGETGWLVGYGICSGIYRLVVSISIALWVGSQLLLLGVALAIWTLAGQLVYPAVTGAWRLFGEARAEGRMRRLVLVASTCFVATAVFLATPMPHSTIAQGLVMVPQETLLRASTDGVVVAVLQRNGVAVRAAEPVLQMANPQLTGQLAVLTAKLRELGARQQLAAESDRQRAATLAEERTTLESEIADLRQTLAGLLVRSRIVGVLTLPRADDLPGRVIRKGDVLGFVTGVRNLEVHAVVDQSAIARIRADTRAVEVFPDTHVGKPIAAKLIRTIPVATDILPSARLGSLRGGAIPVDVRDSDGTTALSDVFRVDVALPMNRGNLHLGQFVYVKFLHEPASIAASLGHWMYRQWLDWLVADERDRPD